MQIFFQKGKYFHAYMISHIEKLYLALYLHVWNVFLYYVLKIWESQV